MEMAQGSSNPAVGTGLLPRAGLSARLLLLTGCFVLLVAVMIYVPLVANYRNGWLGERLSQARAAALILEKTPPDALPRPLVDELLLSMETTMIALRIENSRRLLAISDTPPTVSYEIDLREMDMLRDIRSAFSTLLMGGDRSIRVVGPPPKGGDFVEIVINEQPLRAALLRFSWNVLLVALILSTLTGLLVFAALNALIAEPIKRLADAVLRFRASPEDARSIVVATQRSDELGILERNVADMQGALQQELRQREHLANLGLAVAKINHDLRNMLASAQLMADRLGSLPDPNVQLFVPRLLDALDRAITFCQSTLAYGRAQERMPQLAEHDLEALLREVCGQLMLAQDTSPALFMNVPARMHATLDAEHFARVVTNILRNAVSALEEATKSGDFNARIAIHARRTKEAVEIEIEDNGPGIAPAVRTRLFTAFSGSARPGGTGLGLAIAHELMRAMGGSIALVEREDGVRGTIFRLTLPA
ncbi:MAG: HAMP domain-containing histidine kinase [Proteobacteria bacterium]|nr:HAMP domain-containing histidine kinase [Pseudomonadota bacterium]